MHNQLIIHNKEETTEAPIQPFIDLEAARRFLNFLHKHVYLEAVTIMGGLPLKLGFFECVAEVRDHDNGNVLNQTSMDIYLFNRTPANAAYMQCHKKGVIFLTGISPSKIGTKDFY
jgi:hypothetical protein